MKLISRSAIATVGAAFLTLGIGEAAPALLLVNSQSSVVNLNNQEVLFTIEFKKIPDFFTVDEFGRQADSCQYFIEGWGEQHDTQQ